MDTSKIFDEWEKTLNELANARMELAHINSEIQKTKDALAEIEAHIYVDISKMRDENGKPIYPNETLRQKATMLNLLGIERYRNLKDILRRYEEKKEILIAKISNLKDRVEYFRYLVEANRDASETNP